MRRTVFEAEHEQFREVVREFLAREVAPHAEAWEAAGIVDREVYRAAGKHGVIGFNVPEQFGGGGVADFRFNAIVAEELAVAGIGAVSMITGSAAASTAVWMRASGVRPSSLALAAVVTSSAAEPSLICELLPAVITPSGRKAGFRPAMLSSVPPRRMPSSRLTWVPSGVVTGTICSSNRPSSWAAAAFSCEPRLYSSTWARDSFHWSAIISAPTPWLGTTPS